MSRVFTRPLGFLVLLCYLIASTCGARKLGDDELLRERKRSFEEDRRDREAKEFLESYDK